MDSYLVGFIAADGHNAGSYWTITQTESGIDVFDKFNSRFGYNYREVAKSDWGVQRKFTMLYRNKYHCKYLQTWGIPVGNKTYTLEFPINKPDIEMWHYLRGMFDGDGSFTVERGIYAEVRIMSNRKWCDDCKRYLASCGIESNVYDDNRSPGISSIRLRQLHSIYLFFTNLYINCYIYMNRKYAKWVNFYNKRKYIMDRQTYERDLKKRQEKHLRQVDSFNDQQWQPCLHDSCEMCNGTGFKLDGSFCVHHISCSCPKCTPR